MFKTLLMIMLIFIAVTSFTGCSTSSLKVSEPASQLMADKNNAYVVFTRPNSFLGRAHNIDIMEFDVKEFNTKAVIHLANDEYTIYPVKPGKSYFFTNVGANENITMVDLKPGEIQYLNMGVTGNTIFFPVHLDNTRIKFEDKLLTMNCDKSTIDRYLFTLLAEEEDDESNVFIRKEKSIGDNQYESLLQYNITCEKGKITKIEDTYHGTNISKISKLNLVKPNKSYLKEILDRNSEFKSDIKTLFPVWDLKLRNLPISETPVVFLHEEPSQQNFQRFSTIKVKTKLLNKNVDKVLYNELVDDCVEKFSDINQEGETLNLLFEINNLDDGSMAGRYFTSGFSASGLYSDIGLLDLTITMLDMDGNNIGKMRLTTIEGGGILGGVNTMNSDLLNIAKKYIVYNYLKKK